MTRYDMMMRGGYSSLEEMDEAYRKEEAGAKQRLAVMRAKEGLKTTDYISREEVLEHSEYTENFNLVVPVRFIKAMKAADVQTVTCGRWIDCTFYDPCEKSYEQNFEYKCSYCGHIINNKPNDDNWYCGHCGARMDGDAE